MFRARALLSGPEPVLWACAAKLMLLNRPLRRMAGRSTKETFGPGGPTP